MFLGLMSASISAMTGAIGAIGTACAAIGGAVISTGKVMIDALGAGLSTVKNICEVALVVGKELGLFTPDQSEQDMYELGMCIEHSVNEGITSDEFENNQAYIEYIREKVQLGKENIEKLNNLSEEDKVKYAGLGCAVTLAAIDEKYEIDIPETFWRTSVDLGIMPEQVKPVLDIFEQAHVDPDLGGFLKGELPSQLQKEIYDLAHDQLKNVLSEETLDKFLS